jgi:hypothetical protein
MHSARLADMVWHYFKKDFRLMWPVALALTALQALSALTTVVLGHFNEPRLLYAFIQYLQLLVLLGIVVTSITVVHQDPLPGDRQDWLIRPVKRVDVWLAKVLFVIVLVLAPIFLIDIAEQLTLHLPVPVSLAAAASRSFVLLSVFALPALVLGAITRSFSDALVFGIAATIALTLLTMMTIGMLPVDAMLQHPQGVAWINVASAMLVMLITTVATLAFQYRHRRTVLARGLGLVGVVLALAALAGLPSASAMAVQRWARSGIRSNSDVNLQFVPDPRLMSVKPAESQPLGGESGSREAEAARRAAAMEQIEQSHYAQIHLPLQITGVAAGNILYADQIAARISAANGEVYFQGTGACIRSGNGIGIGCRMNWLEVHAAGVHDGDLTGVPELVLPVTVYERIKDRSVRLELQFAFTTFRPTPTQTIGTSVDSRQLLGLESCATRIDSDGDEVEMRCLSNRNTPSCITAALEDPQSGNRNPEQHACNPEYAPWPIHMPMDVVADTTLSLPFRDRTGLAQYPVDQTVIARARIGLTTYEPVDQFSRRLVIPNIRLADWAAIGDLNPRAGR